MICVQYRNTQYKNVCKYMKRLCMYWLELLFINEVRQSPCLFICKHCGAVLDSKFHAK